MTTRQARVAVIGGGPAGLMAAEVLAGAGVTVDLFDAMPSVGRKFLMAGKGGMNLTHAESSERFVARYGCRSGIVGGWLADFGSDALRQWARELGIETFVGSSGRVFPTDMKAAPLLRAWLHRLRKAGVRFHMRHRWIGFGSGDSLHFSAPDGESLQHVDATVLALGGGSWSQLGSDGAWVPLLRRQGVSVAKLRPANCGFDLAWSDYFRSRFSGEPIKSVEAFFVDGAGVSHRRAGELMVTETGIEGGLVYALAAPLRDSIEATGSATLHLDLAPGRSQERVSAEVGYPRGSRSLTSHLQSRVGIRGVKAGLLREILSKDEMTDPARLASAIKALPLYLTASRPLEEAISSAGGVVFEELDTGLMLRNMPGVFCAGEMLDWEAPTGGYLLSACFASGRVAAKGALAWLAIP